MVEARVAVSFWQRAQTEDALRAVGRDALLHWRGLVMGFLAQAEHDGECEPLADPDAVADELLNIMMGLHVTAMLDPGCRHRFAAAASGRAGVGAARLQGAWLVRRRTRP